MQSTEFADLPREIITQIAEYMEWRAERYSFEDDNYIGAVDLGLTCKSLGWILDLEAIVGQTQEYTTTISVGRLGAFGPVQYLHQPEEYVLNEPTIEHTMENLLLMGMKTATFYTTMEETEDGDIIFTVGEPDSDDPECGNLYCYCSTAAERRKCSAAFCQEIQRAQDFIVAMDPHLAMMMCDWLNAACERPIRLRERDLLRTGARLSFC